MSAGNHAQGVAYHARRLGIPATIVMPEGTPFTKIDRTEALGRDGRARRATALSPRAAPPMRWPATRARAGASL
jgi:threonine dehydratase